MCAPGTFRVPEFDAGYLIFLLKHTTVELAQHTRAWFEVRTDCDGCEGSRVHKNTDKDGSTLVHLQIPHKLRVRTVSGGV